MRDASISFYIHHPKQKSCIRVFSISLSLTKHNALPAPRVPDSISVITRERADFPDTPASLKDTRFKPLTLSLSLSLLPGVQGFKSSRKSGLFRSGPRPRSSYYCCHRRRCCYSRGGSGIAGAREIRGGGDDDGGNFADNRRLARAAKLRERRAGPRISSKQCETCVCWWGGDGRWVWLGYTPDEARDAFE